jgi:hypothetical protein
LCVLRDDESAQATAIVARLRDMHSDLS